MQKQSLSGRVKSFSLNAFYEAASSYGVLIKKVQLSKAINK